MELVARVLAMHVVKGVVGMPLVVERPDAGALESRAEVELPPQAGLHIVSEAPCRMAPCGQRGVDVIVRRTERQETALFALREQHASKDRSAAGVVAMGRSSSSRMVMWNPTGSRARRRTAGAG